MVEKNVLEAFATPEGNIYMWGKKNHHYLVICLFNKRLQHFFLFSPSAL